MSNLSTSSSPAVPAPEPAPAYRSLSLIALLGFVIAGLYAAVVVFGGIVALVRGLPWLLPWWSAFFPIIGAALSLWGLMQIRRSEGTLSGANLARWGLLLSVLVGLSYLAYAGTLFFTLSREAEQFSGDFLAHLSRGDTPSAYRLSLPPADRPAEGLELHDVLENRFNGVTAKMPRGSLTTFEELDYVRILGRLGPETKVETQGVADWEYAAGAYVVRMLFRVDAPGMPLVMVVTVKGAEDKDSGDRLWSIVPGRTGLFSDEPLEANAAWKRTAAIGRQSRDYVDKEFVPLLTEGKGAEAFLCTLPPKERAAARTSAERARLGLFLAAGLGAGALPSATPAAALTLETLADDEVLSTAACQPGLDQFLGGALVRAEHGVYRAPDDLRTEMVDWVRHAFRGGHEPYIDGLRPDDRVKVPLLRRDGDRYVVEHDFAMRIPPKPARYLIEGRIVVEGDAAEAERGSMRSWRIRDIYLTSAKMFPEGVSAQPSAKPTP